MSLLDHFFWRPRGSIPSLARLDASRGLTARWDPPWPLENDHPLPVVELRDAKVVGDLRLAVTRDDLVIGGVQSVVGAKNLADHFAVKRRRFRWHRRYPGTALLMGVANGDNYYHWLLDAVPRWKMFQSIPLPPYDYVLLPAKAAPFQEETLDRMKVPAEKRLHCSKSYVHQFDRLIVPAMPFPLENVSPWVCEYLRSLFPEKGKGPRKLYLTRPADGRRRVVNQAELQNMLLKHGFTVVMTDRLSVAEQARMFAAARYVVAPHGAALTNLIFSPGGARLIEIFHPEHKNQCYTNLAAACGHRYAAIDGQSVNRPGADVLEYRVDVKAVQRMLLD